MSDRVDRKLREVAVAKYGYRHEAEFAAGFLDDAGIPYRLQVDDPAMGLAVSAAATVWVVEMDAARAREVLEIDGDQPPRLVPKPPSPTRRPTSSGDLAPRERIVSVVGGIVLAGIGGVVFAGGGAIAAQGALAAVVVLMVLCGLVGKAPAFLKGLLSALAGTAP